MRSSALAVRFTEEERGEIRHQALLELIRRAAKRKDILEWGRLLFPSKFPLPFCEELHQYFVDVRKDALTNTEAPRNHAKTTIKCFLIPIFQALEEPESFRHYLNVQATADKANAVNMAIRNEFENNEVLLELYGDQEGAKWNEQQFVTKRGVVFTAVGAGQSIRGLNYNNVRPDYIMVDDLYDEEDINNPDSTLKKNSWFWSSLYPARAKSTVCSIHFQGTAINNEDLLEQLKKQARWKSKTFHAIKNWDAKEVLWPELNTFEGLMEDKEDMGSVIFFRELQNERRDDATSLIKGSWLTNWEYDPNDLVFNDKFLLSGVLLGVDPSIGKNSEADATGIALILKTRHADAKGHEFWIDGVWNEHLSLDKRCALLQRIKDVREEGEKPPVSRAFVEGIAGFKDFVAEVRRRTSLPVHEVDSVKDKITNLENKSHFFENGKVHINKNIDPKLRDMLKYQLTTNHPKHDDLRDAVLLCLEDKRGPSITII